MPFILEIVAVASVAGVLAGIVGYPLVLAIWPFKRRHTTGDHLPSVSLVINAFNEAAVIAVKIENALAIDYPAEKFEIVIISDESTDGTDKIAAGYADRGVVVYRQVPRAGKSAGLTRFLPETRGEVIVFSDANSMYEPDAIRQLVRHFGDDRVGYVVGQQRYAQDAADVSFAESLYWRFETWMKSRESSLGSVVGGDGAIYAIRRGLFEPLQADDISDFTLPLKIVTAGYRGIYEPEAICYESTASSFGGEFRRKIRIVNRSFRAVLRVPGALNPFKVGAFSIQLLLHKVLRWLTPFFLLGILVSNLCLVLMTPETVVPTVIYTWGLIFQTTFYGLASLRLVPGLRHWKPVFVAYYFCLVNLAAGIGVLQQLFGRSIATWTPDRGSDELPNMKPYSETSRSV